MRVGLVLHLHWNIPIDMVRFIRVHNTSYGYMITDHHISKSEEVIPPITPRKVFPNVCQMRTNGKVL